MKDKDHQQSKAQVMLNKVPEITLFFWIIKILCTTVGETGADFLNTTLNFGLDGVTVIMGALLVVTLVFQFKTKKYVPGIYWLAVVLISIVGTLITDNLTDRLGVPLSITTIIFAVLLSIVFAVWYKKEKTLSIHTIITTKRESFYWLAILFTFALGTAAGDLLAETINLGYLLSAIIFGGLIASVAISHFVFKVNAILAFWIAYILTRPLGASIGDYLSQDMSNGGLGLGTVMTSMIFLGTILATVIYLTVTKKDVLRKSNFGDSV
ncbi:MAG: COG4705 family protein [Nitrosotalea sp.]